MDADRRLRSGNAAEEVWLALPVRAGVSGHWGSTRPDSEHLPTAFPLVQGMMPTFVLNNLCHN
jgi:hypothetical protein